MAKTLGDYILEGGIKGKFFHQTNPLGRGIYEVVSCGRNIEQSEDRLVSIYDSVSFIVVKYLKNDEINEHELCLGKCLLDQEATPEEIEKARAKESQLSQKVDN